MKYTALALLTALVLPSCSSTGEIDQAKVNALGQLAIGYAVSSGKLTPQDAALIYQAGEIIFPKAPVVVVETTPPLATPQK